MINLGKFSDNGNEVILEECDNGCLKCVSHCKDKNGYVRIRYNGKHERLFRVLFQTKYGPIPKNKLLRHICNNSWCCNVEHLKIGNQKENMMDMIKAGRSLRGRQNIKLRGKQNGSNKLTNEEVKEIYLSKSSYSELSKKYNISKTNIVYIKNKKQWQWLTDKLD